MVASFIKNISIKVGALTIALLFFCLLINETHAQIITTVAGGGFGIGWGGDNGPATKATLAFPEGVAVDYNRNIYIADANNSVIRKVNAYNGIITTVAGYKGIYYIGDSLATNANLDEPEAVAVDKKGDFYIADAFYNIIMKVDASTDRYKIIAGNGIRGFSGDGGAATVASLYQPDGLAIDSAGNIYIEDIGSARIRKVNVSSGIITTIAGNGTVGYSGDGGLAINASLHASFGLAVDQSGNVYIADTYNNVIRKVDARTNIITTIIGNGIAGFGGDGGIATSASLNSPLGLVLDAKGNIYISDAGNNRVRKVDAKTSVITTIAGNGTKGFSGDGGKAQDASLNLPIGLAIDAYGNIYISDVGNNRIREVIYTNPPPPPPTASFSTPDSICLNTPFNITNLSTNQTTNNWNFCSATVNGTVTPDSIAQTCSTTTVNILSSSSINPPPIIYTTPGTYNICLTIDQGLSNQTSYCKQIVVLPPANSDFNFVQDVCNPLKVTFQNKSNPLFGNSFTWSFGDGSSVSAANYVTAYKYYNAYGNYAVTLTNTTGCADTITKTIPVQIKFDDAIITKDTTICANTSLPLKAMAAKSYCWSPAAGLSDASIQNPVASPKVTTTYHLNSSTDGPNLIFNGDFSLGDTGFASMYHDSTNGYDVGTHIVDTTARIWHPFLSQCHDHTTGNGKMLIVNGAPQLGTEVWKQTIPTIQPNTNYIISTWLQSLTIANPAHIQFLINGKPVGDTFKAINDTCLWQQPLTTWNSGNNTSATISIIDWDTIGPGNDFALDDISFYATTINVDSVTITVNGPAASPTVDTVTCLGQPIQLIAAPASTYKWAPSPFYSIDNLQSVTVNPSSNSVFTVNRYNSFGCFATDTFNVRIVNTPLLDFSFNEDICNPLSIQFKNESSDKLSYSWAFGNGTTSSNANPSVVYSAYGTYNVTLKNTDGCLNSITKSITLESIADSLINTKDTVLCNGSQLQLNTVPALAYCWSPTNGLSNAVISNPVAKPLSSTTYYVNAEVLGANLITNGDFSQGNTGFTSQYTYNPSSGYPEGVYWVGTSPQIQPNPWHNQFSYCTDHTTGTGNMMMINGSSTPGTVIWNENIQIQRNTNYAFSAWVESLTAPNPAELQFFINGKTIGKIDTAYGTTCKWKQFYILWNSGDTTSASISILNLNTAGGGNDFAIDDISFAKFSIKTDSIHINVSNAPPVSILNKDTAICLKDSFQLQAVGASSYKWKPVNFVSNNSISNPVAVPTQTTTFVVTGYNVIGCYDSAKINVTVNNLPLLSITNDTGICKGGNIGLLAFSATAKTYSWLPQASLSNIQINNPVATPTDTTTYFVTVTDNNNCSKKDSVTVQVWPLPFVKTRKDTSLCLQNFIVLQTTDSLANSVLWQPSIGLSNVNVLSPTDTALSLGSTKYTVSAFTNHGCLSTDAVTITSLALPKITLNADSISLCVGKSTTLKASSTIASSYVWYPVTGLSNPNSSDPTATPDSTITYHVKVTGNNDCSATDSVFIGVKQLPDFMINPATATICNGDSILITASGGNTYLWQQPLHYPDSSSNFVKPSFSTTYNVKITDTICAVNKTLSSIITVSYPSTISLYKSNDINCKVTTATLIASGAANYFWYDTSSLPIATKASVVVTPNTTTRYTLKAFSNEGCETDTSLIVNVNKADAGDGYAVPNAFTPTGQNNQCFGVKEWVHVINFQLSIYNRWGQQIFATSNLNDCWDGRVNGTMQDAGTYVYEIEASTICGVIHRKGTFVLIR